MGSLALRTGTLGEWGAADTGESAPSYFGPRCRFDVLQQSLIYIQLERIFFFIKKEEGKRTHPVHNYRMSPDYQVCFGNLVLVL